MVVVFVRWWLLCVYEVVVVVACLWGGGCWVLVRWWLLCVFEVVVVVCL